MPPCIPSPDTHGDRFEWGRSRFLDQARLLAGFDHPAIIRVVAFFEANNTAYMVMRYEAGQSLQRVLEHGLRPDEQQPAGLLQPLFDGLDIIHARRIIHRDIKPDNIFIREDNGPVLLDFGSARHAIGSAGQTLTMLVSPGFAPIEQYSRDKETQGPWTDIYALGATLYRAVSGQAPVDSMQRSISIHHDGPDPLRPLLEYSPPGFSPDFLGAIDAALAFKAADRPQTIAEWRAMFSFDTDARPASIALPSDEAPTERPSTQMVSDSAPGNAGTAPARRATAGRQGHFRKYAGIAAVVLAAMTAGGWWLYHAIERGVGTQLPMLRDPLLGGGRGPVMVVVPAGSYLMGSTGYGKDCEADEGPQQTISIPQAFAVSRTEITIEQFRTFIEDSGYITEVEQTGGCYHRTDVWNQYAGLNWRNPGYTQGDDEPVVCVSRRDAEAYAIWSTTQSGRDYRLPTEAEWEYFTRAGTKTSRYWGDCRRRLPLCQCRRSTYRQSDPEHVRAPVPR
ncbi:MAG: bifunctional serine/threonine-protein kinase/formylglycine-generating enzyme family protein [Gammaproteobacteria bacterium]|nr:bifunctional serine/threonine-protein kinase/formylglycine-generating enzyme family protein [Gammaproteobacteria bacterium]